LVEHLLHGVLLELLPGLAHLVGELGVLSLDFENVLFIHGVVANIHDLLSKDRSLESVEWWFSLNSCFHGPRRLMTGVRHLSLAQRYSMGHHFTSFPRVLASLRFILVIVISELFIQLGVSEVLSIRHTC
jgi:hypothetical protein